MPFRALEGKLANVKNIGLVLSIPEIFSLRLSVRNSEFYSQFEVFEIIIIL